MTEEDVWGFWLYEEEEIEEKELEDDSDYIDDSDWENANLSQGDPSDINHQYSNHPYSLYQRRKRRNR